MTIPKELQNLSQWVCWKKENETKVPYTIGGGKASSTNSKTWTNFAHAEKAGGYDGIGFVFTLQDDYVAIDIDNCIVNDKISDEALKWITEFNSYTEVSQSCRGIHIICKSDKTKLANVLQDVFKVRTGVKSSRGECYISGRYFALTGMVYEEMSTIAEVSVDKIVKFMQYVKPTTVPSVSVDLPKSPLMTDEEIIRIATKAKNGFRFESLYNEVGAAGNSEGDQALCNILAFYTQDYDQIKKIIIESPRYRDKFDNHPNYLNNTIEKSISLLKANYQRVNWWTIDTKGYKKLLAWALADHLEDRGDYLYLAKGWYCYRNGCWGGVSSQFIGKLVNKCLDGKGSMVQINEVQNLLEIRVETPHLFNKNLNIAVFENGTLDIFKGFREHRKDDFHTISIKAKYDKEAKCPRWVKFVENVKDVELLQEMLGYLLVVNRSGKSFFVMVGPTDCGKSVVSDLIIKLFNEVSMTSLQAICDPANRWAVGEMFGVPLNINTDLSSGLLKDTGVLKQFTGDGTIRYEMKGRTAIIAQVVTKLVFICNQLPRNKDVNEAFYNRLQIIRFGESIAKDKQDKGLFEKLWAERDGIILWALEGLKRLIKNNWTFTRSEDVIARYKEESNSALLFLKEECEFDEKSKPIPISYLYDRYKAWCTDSGVWPYHKQKFSSIIAQEKGIELGRTNKYRYIKGLKFTERGD